MKTLFLKCSTFLLLFLSFMVSNHLPAQDGGPNAPDMFDAMASKRDVIISNGLKKLSAQERSALISLISDTNMYKASRGISAKDRARIEESLRELQSRFGPPKWMGPNGETYDTYHDYLTSVWGVPYPSPTNPYDPFE